MNVMAEVFPTFSLDFLEHQGCQDYQVRDLVWRVLKTLIPFSPWDLGKMFQKVETSKKNQQNFCKLPNEKVFITINDHIVFEMDCTRANELKCQSYPQPLTYSDIFTRPFLTLWIYKWNKKWIWNSPEIIKYSTKLTKSPNERILNLVN